MGIIKTSLGISKTFRNVGRMREIVLVFAKHGFDEFISSGVRNKIPNLVIPKSSNSIKEELTDKAGKDWNQVLGFRLRKCFEELGPAFVKFGQLLSSREDLFDQAFIDEMKVLRDKVKPIPYQEVLAIIEKSLGKSWSLVFSEIEHEPVGTASIGVVHRATLRDGSKVVVKVRRPGIKKEIETDFDILNFLAQQAEKASEELKYLGLSRVVSDFALTLKNELNFNVEALNAERLKKNIEVHDTEGIYAIPYVYKEFSTEEVLVIEEFKGIPFSDTERINALKEEVIPKLEYGVQLFILTFLKDGFFHADLHGGNFFYLDNKKIGIVDFGLMGNLSKKARHHFVAIIYALTTHSYENLVFEFLDVAEYDSVPDIDGLVRDVREGLTPYLGLSVRQTNFSELLIIVLNTLKKHQIYVPRDWYIVFRALITLDGVGRDVGLDLNIYAFLEKDIREIVQSSFNQQELMEEGIWAGRDLLSSFRVVPRHIRWFMREWARKNYAIEIINRGYEKEIRDVARSIHFLGHAIVASVFLYSGVSVIGDIEVTQYQDVPFLSWIFWALGLIVFSLGYSRRKS